MRYGVNKRHKKKDGYLKRYSVPVIGIILIVLLMAVIKFLNSLEFDTIKEEELLIPKIQEQSELEIIKLNPDSHVKEGW